MEGDEQLPDAPRPQRIQHRPGEMQPCRRRGDRPFILRVDGLVALAIRAFRRPVDIGWERDRPCLMQKFSRAGRQDNLIRKESSSFSRYRASTTIPPIFLTSI